MSAHTGTSGLLVQFSSELADAVELAARGSVTVHARRRMSATGIVWSNDGVIVTADHVVEQDEDITVTLPDGSTVPAKLLGRDPGSDVAVLKAAATGLVPAKPAAPGRVGALVLAVGRPAGDPMATIGVISAITGPVRSWRGGFIDSLLQTDVTMYPGFSGSALVDASGAVLGMNTSLLVRGVSVAVPTAVLDRVARAIQTQGHVKRGYLGISTQQVALPEALAQSVGTNGALLVVGLESGGPADKAGVLIGDILVSLGGKAVADADELQRQLGPDTVGATVALRVLRGGAPHEVAVVVGERQ